MKQASHIMLQRFVRSMTRTEPRPYLMVDLPWFRVGVIGAVKSPPGCRLSIRSRKAGSLAMTSTNSPCFGQVFSITIWPSRSLMVARISPGVSSRSTFQVVSPDRIRARASFTHPGHSESVSRGHPSWGRFISAPFCSFPGAQSGWKPSRGFRSRVRRTTGHRAPAVFEAVASIFRITPISTSAVILFAGIAPERTVSI